MKDDLANMVAFLDGERTPDNDEIIDAAIFHLTTWQEEFGSASNWTLAGWAVEDGMVQAHWHGDGDALIGLTITEDAQLIVSFTDFAPDARSAGILIDRLVRVAGGSFITIPRGTPRLRIVDREKADAPEGGAA